MEIETRGKWRLFTKRDFQQTLRNWEPSDSEHFFLWNNIDDYPNGIAQKDYIHAEKEAYKDIIRSFSYHTNKLEFEHGPDRRGHGGKLPRANKYRPYCLTLDGKLVAAIVFRASEAFNLCEIDAFLTTEVRGIETLEATRAALLFAFSDAAKNGGSMAVQFTKFCASKGFPPHVRELAERSGVHLEYTNQGAISPNEVRELFLRLCGLSEPAQERIRELAKRGFFSIERVCYLITKGLWPIHEVEIVLRSTPFPDLLLGSSIDPSSRHLYSQAMALGRTAVLGGILKRALQYIKPETKQEKYVEQEPYLKIVCSFNPIQLSVTHKAFPKDINLQNWMTIDDFPFHIAAGTTVVAFLRPREREEIRVFLKHDLQQASAAAKRNQNVQAVLVYPDDYMHLSEDERVEANRVAKQLQLTILACPEANAGLEAEVWRRLRVGRTVRQ